MAGDGSDEGKLRKRRGNGRHSSPGADRDRGGTAKKDQDDGPPAEALEKVYSMLEARNLEGAEAMLLDLMAGRPGDATLLHNLGVLYTEQGRWVEAEDSFRRAFDNLEKEGKVNYATAYGLAVALTEKGGEQDLLQSEALLRDILARSIAEEEKGIQETYRGFVSLAQNLEKQKRWAEVAELWTSAHTMASSMFGEDSEAVAAHSISLARAQKLARWQGYLRRTLWSLTVAMPVGVAWYWSRRAGGLWALIGMSDANVTSATAASLAS